MARGPRWGFLINERGALFVFGYPAMSPFWALGGFGPLRIGVFRRGEWWADMNGNNAWDLHDGIGEFRASGGLPVVGPW